MSNSLPEIKNPLKHSGTGQYERLAAEMAFDYVQIEERNESHFLDCAEKLMKTICYYDENHVASGSWNVFFATTIEQSQPHKALFIAFLRLMEALYEHINGLSKRHLDYYYTDVLQFVKKEAQPAQAHLFFNIAGDLKQRLLEQGTLFDAGKNEAGQKILFELVNEIVVNKTKIKSCLQLYKHDEETFGGRFFKKDSSELLAEGNASSGFWGFGEHQLESLKDTSGNYYQNFLDSEEQTMDEAEVGFAFSSPKLRLEEGKRTITLTLSIENAATTKFNLDDFNISITGEEDWWTPNSITIVKTSTTVVTLELKIEDDEPAVVDYDSEIHQGSYDSKYPVIRVVLKHDNSVTYAYQKLTETIVTKVKLLVDVSGVRSLIVQNDVSVLDASKPFTPFGPIPSLGNNFYIGQPEILRHELSELTLNITWKNIPNSKFNTYYANYEEVNNINNAAFTMQLDHLENKVWTSLKTNESLFDGADAKSTKTIKIDNTTIGSFRKMSEPPSEDWTYRSYYGFLRCKLIGPDLDNFQAFGHSVHGREVLNNSDPITGITPINAPYTPTIEELRLNYTTEAVDFTENEEDQFFHIAPFGEKRCELNETTPLLPKYKGEGELYIGLSELIAPQSVQLLFQLMEGTADADQSLLNTDLAWYYLVDDEWTVIDQLRISKDTTFGLLQTGIIRFDLPKEINTKHYIMPDGLFWLKAVIPSNTAGIEKIQNIHTQGANISAVNTQGIENIAPETVSKLVNGNRGLSKVIQPYASFDGHVAETEEKFYTRITERLRHKERGIMIYDYERLVLEAFPHLFKVKCLNHANYQTEMVAGNVMIAVIPNLLNKGTQNIFQPKLSIRKRREIYDFLRERISPFIYLRVENPVYEPIKFSFSVGFHKGYDEGYYGMKLHEELQAFLSPWAFSKEWDESSKLVFGGELHKSVILKFIEDIYYVDFVNDFNMYHQYQDASVRAHFLNVFDGLSAIDDQGNNTIVHYEHESIANSGAVDIKMALNIEDTSTSNIFIGMKLRLLKALTEASNDNEMLNEFMEELTYTLKVKIKNNIPLTKVLVQSMVKAFHYVDEIVDIQLYHELSDDYVLEDVDLAVAKTSRSVMVTSENHYIGVYKAGDYNCDGNVTIGIGTMVIEADFIVEQNEITENTLYNAR